MLNSVLFYQKYIFFLFQYPKKEHIMLDDGSNVLKDILSIALTFIGIFALGIFMLNIGRKNKKPP